MFILDEQEIIEKLIELDVRALTINSRRKNQLVEITNQYKKEEQEIIKNYHWQTEKENVKTAQKILQEAQEEIEQFREKNKEILENMELEFKRSLATITAEIIQQIFQFNRENHG